jgi:hypothetical protein
MVLQPGPTGEMVLLAATCPHLAAGYRCQLIEKS